MLQQQVYKQRVKPVRGPQGDSAQGVNAPSVPGAFNFNNIGKIYNLGRHVGNSCPHVNVAMFIFRKYHLLTLKFISMADVVRRDNKIPLKLKFQGCPKNL